MHPRNATELDASSMCLEIRLYSSKLRNAIQQDMRLDASLSINAPICVSGMQLNAFGINSAT